MIDGLYKPATTFESVVARRSTFLQRSPEECPSEEKEGGEEKEEEEKVKEIKEFFIKLIDTGLVSRKFIFDEAATDIFSFVHYLCDNYTSSDGCSEYLNSYLGNIIDFITGNDLGLTGLIAEFNSHKEVLIREPIAQIISRLLNDKINEIGTNVLADCLINLLPPDNPSLLTFIKEQENVVNFLENIVSKFGKSKKYFECGLSLINHIINNNIGEFYRDVFEFLNHVVQLKNVYDIATPIDLCIFIDISYRIRSLFPYDLLNTILKKIAVRKISYFEFNYVLHTVNQLINIDISMIDPNFIWCLFTKIIKMFANKVLNFSFEHKETIIEFIYLLLVNLDASSVLVCILKSPFRNDLFGLFKDLFMTMHINKMIHIMNLIGGIRNSQTSEFENDPELNGLIDDMVSAIKDDRASASDEEEIRVFEEVFPDCVDE